MNEKAVKQLTKKGCIVEKNAAELLTEEDTELIEDLDTPPMYLTEAMLQKLRENHLTMIQFHSDCPEFIGTDMETYDPFEEGDTAKIPEDNAEILINRGRAKKQETV